MEEQNRETDNVANWNKKKELKLTCPVVWSACKPGCGFLGLAEAHVLATS